MSKSKTGHPRRYALIVVFFSLFSMTLGIMLTPWKAEAQQRMFLPAIFKDYPIANANFDLGRDGYWTEFSSNGFILILNTTDLQGIIPQSGSWSAWLGGADSETSILSQTVPVPPSATFLNYFYWLESFDPGDATDPLNPICNFDTAEVRLGANLLRVHDLCEANNTNRWALGQINVTAFRGQTLELSFQVVTDDLADSWSNFFLDTIFFSAQ